MGVFNLGNFLIGIFGDAVEDEKRQMIYAAEASNSVRIDYLLEVAVFLYIILNNYRYIPNERRLIVMQNMAFGFMVIMLVFVRSTNGGRIAWFYSLGIISSLTALATSERKVVNIGMLVIVLNFGLYWRILTGWGSIGVFYPYKTFLTPGHRPGDHVWEEYEYDEGYDDDKFYRL